MTDEKKRDIVDMDNPKYPVPDRSRFLPSASIADTAGAIDASVVKRMLSQHGVSYAGGHSFLMNVPMLVDIMRALQRQSVADTAGANTKVLEPPARIYLNVGDLSDIDDAALFENLDEVTWCQHRIDEHDIEYVLAAPPAPSVAEWQPRTEHGRRAMQTINGAAPSVADAAGATHDRAVKIVTALAGNLDACSINYVANELREHAAAGASEGQPTAKQQYDAADGAQELDQLERLRFFCSLAMNGQDWLDVEPFFDALKAGASEGQAVNPACSLSWGGFNVHGDDKSIREVRRIMNEADRCAYLVAELTALRDRAAGMEKDAERIDWLEQEDEMGCFYNIDHITANINEGFNGFKTLREAIDAAMKEPKQ